jgi:hypothetical protein
MAKPQPLEDEFLNKELDRMRMMKRFPELPAARQEMIRTLRHISENRTFLHELITFFVDGCERCPVPHELRERAGIIRSAEAKPLGNPHCEKCGGTGWIHSTRTVKLPGMQPYEAESSERCNCSSA